jgi:uncharacterized repeat protein (TIGR02543 family)
MFHIPLRTSTPLFAAYLCLQAAALSEAASIVAGLDRTVVVTGAETPGLLGRPVSGIRLYRIRNGAWEPVPFQIDETDGSGTLEGAKNGNLDASDEIVFMAADAGDSVMTDLWPDDAAAMRNPRVHLALSDPARPSWKASVYAFLSSTLPLSGVRYVRYDPGQDLVETDLYQIVHGSTHGFQEILKILPGAGGDGLDFLDKQKLRLKIHIAQVNKDILLRETMDQDVELITGFSIRVKVGRKRVVAVQNAVVRQNRILVLSISARGSFLGNNVGFSDSLRFHTVYEPAASRLHIGPIPVPDADEFDPLAVRLSCDWNASASGMKFYNASNTGGILINGKTDNPDASLPWPGENGYLVTADPSGSAAVRNASVVGIWSLRGSPPGNSHTIYYKDDSSYEGNDTGDRRSYGDFGIQVSQDPMHDTLDVQNTMIYFPSTRTWAEADSVISAWTRPPSASGTDERRTVAFNVRVEPITGGSVNVYPGGPENPPYGMYGRAYADSVSVLTAHPADGYVFAGWEGDLSGTENPASILMDGPKSVTARFLAVSRYTVTSDPAGLPCLVDGDTVTTPAAFDWIEGSVHSVSMDTLISTGEGSRLHFLAWNGVFGRSVSFPVEPADAVWTARFERQHLLTVSVFPPDGGTVSGIPSDPWLTSGTMVSLLAQPLPGYHFIFWNGQIRDPLANPLLLTMTSPKSVSAVFDQPPSVAVPDTSFAEDGSLILPESLVRGWVSAGDVPPENLTIRFLPGTVLAVDTVEAGIRIRSGRPNWNGSERLIISAKKPSGLEGRDTTTVTVTPVPDPPAAFSLLSPQSEVWFGEKPDSIRFEWEPSSDPDGDAVTYLFRMDTTGAFSSPRLLVRNGLTGPETTILWAKEWGPGTIHWNVTASDGTGRETACTDGFSFHLNFIEAPKSCVLRQSYPNPFNASTVIEFGIPAPGRVELRVFDTRGRLVRTLADGSFEEGYYTRVWDGRDGNGKRAAAGLYVIRMKAGRFHASKKTVLVL